MKKKLFDRICYLFIIVFILSVGVHDRFARAEMNMRPGWLIQNSVPNSDQICTDLALKVLDALKDKRKGNLNRLKYLESLFYLKLMEDNGCGWQIKELTEQILNEKAE